MQVSQDSSARAFAQHLLTLFPKREIRKVLGDEQVKWSPRWYQEPVWKYLNNGGKRAICIWHRRAGKDDVCLHWTHESAQQKPATYWHMLPQANQARKAIWEAVNPHTGRRRIDEAFPLHTRANTREQEMFIRFKGGATWQVVGSDNFDSLVGSPPYGIVFSEWALADPHAWAYLRPILRENGGWALFITTPRGHNHAESMYQFGLESEEWFSELLSAETTDVFSEAELAQELAEYIAEYGEDLGTALFEQEYLCSFHAALPGAYFAAQLKVARNEGRICRVPYNPLIHVDTWWDLGVDDSTSIWFTQDVGREIHLLKYYESQGEGLEFYVRKLAEFEEENGWVYGFHTAPHDIRVRELGTGKSRYETAKELGLNFQIAQRPERKEDSIEAARKIFSRCWFDEEGCRKGLESLASYTKVYDEINKVFKPTPLHNWASHGADSFQNMAMGHGTPGQYGDLDGVFG